MLKSNRAAIIIAGFAVAASLAGCGEGPEADKSAQADGNQATGKSIPVGMISQEDSPSGSFPENRENVEAALEYINKELGGIDGRPLELHSCITDGSPEKSGTCAREILDENPLMFIGGVDFGTATSLPVLARAGVSQLGGVPILPADYTSENVFQFVPGSAGAYPALAGYMVNVAGVKSAAIIHADDAAGRAVATTYGSDIFNELGVTDVNMVAVDPNAADFTTAVTKANDGDPDGIMIAQAAAGCTRVMQTAQGLGMTTPMFYSSACATHAVAKAGGSAAEGAYFVNSLESVDGDSDDAATYRRVMEEYRPDTPIGGIGAYSFMSAMNAYSVASTLESDDLNPEGITKAMKNTVDHDSFMGHDFTCDGQQLEGSPSVCTAWQKMWQYEGGKFVDLSDEWVDGSVAGKQ